MGDIPARSGRGPEANYASDPGVLTISIHQDRSFPVETGSVEDTGEGAAAGTNVNVNLPAGVGDPGYLDAMDRIVCPILRAFGPELVIVACGVDASLFDPLSRLGVTASGFAAVAGRLVDVAAESCGGRLLSVQEGGYSHVYAPFCWLAIIETIAGLERHPDPFEDFVAGQACCRELAPWHVAANDGTVAALSRHWSL
jgi:acetoin utilization deacetylase AcuC-like enzyme